MVDQFDEIVFALEPGGVSTVFRTPFGYHVTKLVDRRPAGIRPFDEVREAIEAQLHQEKQQQALEQFLDQLRAPAEIREVRHRGPAKDEQSVPPSS
jgi:parvulin-like peptidyl-prolyl isomerase